MSDAKTSALPALLGADLADNDLFPVVDTSAGADGSKHMVATEARLGLITAAAVAAAGAVMADGSVPFSGSVYAGGGVGAPALAYLGIEGTYVGIGGEELSPSMVINAVRGAFASFYGLTSNGTRAAPTAITDEQGLLSWNAIGHDGTNYRYAYSIYGEAAEAWTPSAGGTNVYFYSNKIGEIDNTAIPFFEFEADAGVIVGRADMSTELIGTAIKVNGETGLASFSGAITNITVKNGIITAAS